MDFEKLNKSKVLYVYSNRVCQELIRQFGTKWLTDIMYFDSKRDEGKRVKAFVFKNEPEIFTAFRNLVGKQDYKEGSAE